MTKIKESRKYKIRQVEELQITVQKLEKTIQKRKKWSALGIDRTSNFWSKIFRSTWEKLAAVSQA